MTNSSEFFKKLKKVDGGYQITLDDGSVIVGSQISDIIRQMMKKSNDEPSFKKISLPDNLKYFVPRHQIKTMASSDEFEDIANELSEIFEMMPKTYEQDGKGDNAKVYLHYFYGDSHWYIIEKDSEKEQLQMFGYAVLNGDLENAELGYISFDELNENNVELDFHFDIDTLGNIKKELNQRYTYARGGKLKKYDYVAVSETENGWWYVISRPTTKEKAKKAIDLGVPTGEKGKVVTIDEAKSHKKTIGGEYLFAKGGSTDFGMLSVKAGYDNNPKPTYADKIAGAKMGKMADGGSVGIDWDKLTAKPIKSKRAENNDDVYNILWSWQEKYDIQNAQKPVDIETPYNRGIISDGTPIIVYLFKKGDKYIWSWKKTYANGGGVGKGYKGVRISHYKVGNKIFIDYMDAMEYCDENNISYDEIINTKEYARGGMSEHGLKTGDKITGRSGRGIAQDKKIYQVLATPKSGKPYLLYDGMLMTEKTAERKAMEANRMWAPDILYSVVEVNQIWDGYARGGKVGDFEVGQSVIISRYNDNENYADYVGKELVITHKAVNSREHRGFDESMTGQGLYDFVVRKTGEEVPFSLYDYEIEQYARGGMSEHGLKTGDKITGRSGSTGVKLYNKNRKESGVVNLDKGIRKTKSYGKSEPTIVRGFVDDEPYEYGKGGGIEGKKYIVVCRDTNTGEEQEFEVFAEDRQEAREIALGYCEFSNPKIISIEIYAKGGSMYSRNASKSKNIVKKPIKKKKKKEPTIVRGFVDDEPYEFKKGGSIHSSLMDDFFN